MTRFLIIIFAILASVNILISQDDMIDDLEFEEAPVSEESPVYFAFGGGYIGSFYAFNLDDINIKLDEGFNLPGFSGSMFVSGVHGFTSVGIIPNLRLGFFGSGGSMEVTDNTDSVLSGSKLSASITGITIDYGLVLFKHFAVLPGIQGGWSSMNFDIYKNKKNIDWDGVNSSGDGSYYSQNLEGSFWFVQPNLQIEYALTPFLIARGSVGYNLSFSPTWLYNSSAEVKNVPNTISTTAFNWGFGVCVGLFNF